MTKKLTLSIAYLYPKSMNIYGDRGNIIALTKRCQWHEINTTVTEIEVGELYDPKKYDLVFAGGGQDNHQLRIAQDLQTKTTAIKESVERNVVFLLICGSYQLFGHYFKTHNGDELKGISVFDLITVASNKRKIGNVIIETNVPLQSPLSTLVGFENHSGNTFITKNSTTKPLGSVLSGLGNNGKDKTEGAVYKNCIGTYLHGSFLPKNPHFADYLISSALTTKYNTPITCQTLNDSLEIQAHQYILQHRNQ